MTQSLAIEPWPDSVDWRRVSGRLILIEEFHVLISTVIVVAANLGVMVFFEDRIPRLIPQLVAVAAVAIGVVRAGVVARAVRSWGYTERGEDLLVRHGVFVRKMSIVPYARIQFVDVTAAPLERMFGLATVTLHTAAAASDARVPGLVATEAARLRDRLALLGESRSEGL